MCVVLLIPICPEVWQGWGRGKLIKAFPGEVRRPISGWLSLRPHLAHHSLRKVKSPEIPSSSTWYLQAGETQDLGEEVITPQNCACLILMGTFVEQLLWSSTT